MSAMYMMYRRGPSTDPWATPDFNLAHRDLRPPKWTVWVRSTMNDRIQLKAVPATPYEMDSQSNRRELSTVSNVARTSRRVRSDTSIPQSVAVNKSESTRSRAESVEWCLLNPDWSLGRRLLAARYSESCRTTILSVLGALGPNGLNVQAQSAKITIHKCYCMYQLRSGNIHWKVLIAICETEAGRWFRNWKAITSVDLEFGIITAMFAWIVSLHVETSEHSMHNAFHVMRMRTVYECTSMTENLVTHYHPMIVWLVWHFWKHYQHAYRPEWGGW